MNDKNDLSINVRPEVAGGHYSNLAIISHSYSEFVIDFAAALPGIPKPDVQTRVVMAPDHFKRLLYAINDNLRKYEEQFGEISLDTPQSNGFPIHNGGTKS